MHDNRNGAQPKGGGRPYVLEILRAVIATRRHKHRTAEAGRYWVKRLIRLLDDCNSYSYT